MRCHRPPNAHAPGQRGFTLIELLITLAVVAMLFAFAMPTVSGAAEAVRASDARSALVLSIMTTINRATLIGTRAVLCPSNDGRTCRGDSDWSHGWIAFFDDDGDGALAPGQSPLQRQPALTGKVRLTTTSGRTHLVFQGDGGNAGSNVTFTLCDGRGPSKAVTLVLNNQGRLREGIPDATALAATCQQG
jgi:type IV fimbrial biogenesis protein FimT